MVSKYSRDSSNIKGMTNKKETHKKQSDAEESKNLYLISSEQ